MRETATTQAFAPFYPLAQDEMPSMMQAGMTVREEPTCQDDDPTIPLPDDLEVPPMPDVTLPSESIDAHLLAPSMAFVPRQTWETPYDLPTGFSRGTIFPVLDLPFLGGATTTAAMQAQPRKAVQK